MSARHFMTNVAVILGIMAAISLLEVAAPLFPRTAARRGRNVANFGLTATSVVHGLDGTDPEAVRSLPGLLSMRVAAPGEPNPSVRPVPTAEPSSPL